MINLYLKGNIFEEYGGDYAASNVFNGISIDWEFPTVPSLLNQYDKNDGIYMMNLFKDIKTSLNLNNFSNVILSTAILGNPSSMGLDTSAYHDFYDGNLRVNPEFDENKVF